MADFSPLFRTAIGFDRMARLDRHGAGRRAGPDLPPYNIAKTGEDSYRLTMAVAGFGRDSLEITAKDNQLVVTGRLNEETTGEVLYRGIAGRAFERRFALADHIVVEGRRSARRAAACRPEARGARGAEAAADRDRPGADRDGQPSIAMMGCRASRPPKAVRLGVFWKGPGIPAPFSYDLRKKLSATPPMRLLAGDRGFGAGNLAAQLANIGVQFLHPSGSSGNGFSRRCGLGASSSSFMNASS